MPVNSVKPAPKVASSAFPVSPLYPFLGILPAAASQSSSKPPDENAKALAEMKDALQTLGQELRDWKTASSNVAQTNRNFQFRDVDLVFVIEVFRTEVLEETILSIPALSVKIVE